MALCQRFYALCKPVHITKPQQFAQMFPWGLATIKNNKLTWQISIMLGLNIYLLSFLQQHVYTNGTMFFVLPQKKDHRSV